MADQHKTKAQLIAELALLRQRVAALEAGEAEHRLIQKVMQQAEAELQRQRERLEELVEERTAQLNQVITTLEQEMAERSQVQAALEESRYLLQEITDLTPTILYIYDLEQQRNVFVNRQVELMLGYTAADIQAGRALFQQIIHPADWPRFETRFDRLAHSTDGHMIETEYRLRHADGHWRWISTRDTVFTRRRDGSPRQILGAVLDITERKEAEAALKTSARFLQATLDALTAHIAILDETGVIVAVNAAWRRFAQANGWQGPGDGVGMNYLGVCAGVYGDEAETAAQVAAGIRAVMAGQLEEFQFEYPCHGPGEQRWFNLRVTCFENAGQLKTVVAHENITRPKLIQKLLQANQAELQAVQDASPLGMFLADLQGNHLYINPNYQHISGLSLEAGLEISWLQIVHPDDCRRVKQEWDEAVRRQRPYEGIQRFQRPDGQVSWVSIKAAPIRNEGLVTVYVGTVEDITERRSAEERLRHYIAEVERRNEELQRFAYIVSHDLRAPLMNLKGFAGELRAAGPVLSAALAAAAPHLDPALYRAAETALNEDVPEALGFIDFSVDRMDSLINAILNLARLGRRQLLFEPLDMQTLVQETLHTLAHQITQRQVQVTVGPLPTVQADQVSMQQILSNILNNAILYLEPGRPGRIEISSQSGPRETIFHIRDNGCGINQADMPKVFEPFRRAGKQDVPGEGMGLAYVQVLVRRHGGRIWCESQPGQGATFSFALPLQPPSAGAGLDLPNNDE